VDVGQDREAGENRVRGFEVLDILDEEGFLFILHCSAWGGGFRLHFWLK